MRWIGVKFLILLVPMKAMAEEWIFPQPAGH